MQRCMGESRNKSYLITTADSFFMAGAVSLYHSNALGQSGATRPGPG